MRTNKELIEILYRVLERCEYINNKQGSRFVHTKDGRRESCNGLCIFTNVLFLQKIVTQPESNRMFLIISQHKNYAQTPYGLYWFDTEDIGNGHPKQLRLDFLQKILNEISND